MGMLLVASLKVSFCPLPMLLILLWGERQEIPARIEEWQRGTCRRDPFKLYLKVIVIAIVQEREGLLVRIVRVKTVQRRSRNQRLAGKIEQSLRGRFADLHAGYRRDVQQR
jgi:hypothetical protein